MLHWNWFFVMQFIPFFREYPIQPQKKRVERERNWTVDGDLVSVCVCLCWFCILFGVDKTYIKKVSTSWYNSPFIRASIPFQIIWAFFTVKWESNRAKMRFQITYNYVYVIFSPFSLQKFRFCCEYLLWWNWRLTRAGSFEHNPEVFLFSFLTENMFKSEVIQLIIPDVDVFLLLWALPEPLLLLLLLLPYAFRFSIHRRYRTFTRDGRLFRAWGYRAWKFVNNKLFQKIRLFGFLKLVFIKCVSGCVFVCLRVKWGAAECRRCCWWRRLVSLEIISSVHSLHSILCGFAIHQLCTMRLYSTAPLQKYCIELYVFIKISRIHIFTLI